MLQSIFHRRNSFVVLSSRLCSSGSQILNNPLLHKLDQNSSPKSPLDASSRSKLTRSLESKGKVPIDPVEQGIMDTQSSEIVEILEDALQSRALRGIFKEAPETSDLIYIKHVKINRDLSHVDVTWGSDLFEDFVAKALSKFGEKEGGHIGNRIFSSVNKTLQRKESKFRTILMRSVQLRRVPRIYFSPPSLKKMADKEANIGSVEEWVKEEQERIRTRDAWEDDVEDVNHNEEEGMGGEVEARMPIDLWMTKSPS